MDTLDNQDISGKRVKIINEDNDPVWGTVETVDYVKDKIGLMRDGQNGRLEYWFKCDIKKIFIMDDSGGSSAFREDRRAFDISVSARVSDLDLDKSSFYSIGSNSGRSLDKSEDKSIGNNMCKKNTKAIYKDGDKASNVEEYGRDVHDASDSFKTVDTQEKLSSYHEVPSFFKAPKMEKSPLNYLDKDEIPIFCKTTGRKEESDLAKQLECVNIGSQRREPPRSTQHPRFEPPRSTQHSRFEPPRSTQHLRDNQRHDQESRRPDRFPKRGIKTENVHLRNLHHVDMNNVLGRTHVEQMEELNSYVDEDQFPFLMLPSVSSTSELCTDINGQVVNPSKQQKVIRQLLWKVETEPPVLHTPSRLYTIEEIGDLFEEAIERCRCEPRIGVNLEGELLGRSGVLCYLIVSTVQDVFMFDILKMGGNAFDYGLRSILQDENIMKVFHDVRMPSDILFNQYDITLENVFDTLSADVVFRNSWSVNKEVIQRYTRTLPQMAKDYLGVADSDLFSPKYRNSKLKEDTSIWRQRPLPKHLILGVARKTIYLLPLQPICRDAVELPFRRGVSVLLSCVRDADEPDAAAMVHDNQLSVLPPQIRNVLIKDKRHSS